MTDPTLTISEAFLGSFPSTLNGPVSSTLKKMKRSRDLAGLHIEPLQKAKDRRLRSIRVNKKYRLLAFLLTEDPAPYWLLEGVYVHDKAYERAEGLGLHQNPRTGLPETFLATKTTDGDAKADGDASTDRDLEPAPSGDTAPTPSPDTAPSPSGDTAPTPSGDTAPSPSGDTAPTPSGDTAPSPSGDTAPTPSGETDSSATPTPKPTPQSIPLGGFTPEDLIDQLGIDQSIAHRAVVATENSLLDLAESATGAQGMMLVELAAGDTLDQVRERYDTGVPVTGSDDPGQSEALIASLASDAARSRFHLVANDAELERILESGDFARWQVFLHPEQDTYVHLDSRGPYRLTGAAGTGKTVVLIHRAVRLATESTPTPRVILTTYTRTLADDLDSQVRKLDSAAPRARRVGEPGILTAGIDRIARRIVEESHDLPGAMMDVVGWRTSEFKDTRTADAWDEAIEFAGAALEEKLRTRGFFTSEYSEVILPARVTTLQQYLRAGRAGRGTPLGRKQRAAVWSVIEEYRRAGMRDNKLDYDEVLAVAARILDRGAESGQRPQRVADHVLIDEGQDLRPTHWLLLRALAPLGDNDLFIAEDAHQRIYSNPVKLSRYGIRIHGRSRRLKFTYRTTAEILAYAEQFLARGGDYDLDALGVEGNEPAIDAGYARSARSGPEPWQLPGSTALERYDHAARLLRTWIEEANEARTEPSTLAVLTRTKQERDSFDRAMKDRGVKVNIVERGKPPTGAPLVMTLHRSKGMEFRRLLLFGVKADEPTRQVPAGAAYDEDAAKQAELREWSLLYVGASRARDELVVG